MRTKYMVAGLLGAVAAAGLWWRRHPSACPYGQRFWIEAPHPLITRERLREALEPRAGETVLEIGPGTGYYTLEVAQQLLPGGTLHVYDLQQEMLDHTMRRAGAAGVNNSSPDRETRRSSRMPTPPSTGSTWSPCWARFPIRTPHCGKSRGSSSRALA